MFQRTNLGLPFFLSLSVALHLLALLPFIILHFLDIEKPLAGGGGTVTIDLIGISQTKERGGSQSRLRNQLFDRLSGQPIDSLRSRPADYQRPSSSGTAKASSSETESPPAPSTVGSGPEGLNPTLAAIRIKIERAKHYPELAQKSGIEGKALIHFEIDEKGLPQNISLKKSSGSPLLDQEALVTIHQASPFPTYPNPLEVWIKFEMKR